MMASDVEIGSSKKGKVNRPSELEEILLGYYIKTQTGKSGVMRISWDRTVAAW